MNLDPNSNNEPPKRNDSSEGQQLPSDSSVESTRAAAAPHGNHGTLASSSTSLASHYHDEQQQRQVNFHFRYRGAASPGSPLSGINNSDKPEEDATITSRTKSVSSWTSSVIDSQHQQTSLDDDVDDDDDDDATSIHQQEEIGSHQEELQDDNNSRRSTVATLNAPISKLSINMNVLPFGWIKHRVTIMWRGFVKRYSMDDTTYPEWKNVIATYVQQHLLKMGVSKYYIRKKPVRRKQQNQNPKALAAITKGGNKKPCPFAGAAWRPATPEEFVAKTKRRFEDDRTEAAKALITPPNRTGRPPKNKANTFVPPPQWIHNRIPTPPTIHNTFPTPPTPHNTFPTPPAIHNVTFPTAAASQQSQMICPNNEWFPISKRNVCFEWKRHPGYIRFLQVLATFSDNHSEYPEWRNVIADRVMDLLAKDDFALYLVFRNLENQPCHSIHDGMWVQASPEEIVAITKRQFRANREQSNNNNQTQGWYGQPYQGGETEEGWTTHDFSGGHASPSAGRPSPSPNSGGGWSPGQTLYYNMQQGLDRNEIFPLDNHQLIYDGMSEVDDDGIPIDVDSACMPDPGELNMDRLLDPDLGQQYNASVAQQNATNDNKVSMEGFPWEYESNDPPIPLTAALINQGHHFQTNQGHVVEQNPMQAHDVSEILGEEQQSYDQYRASDYHLTLPFHPHHPAHFHFSSSVAALPPVMQGHWTLNPEAPFPHSEEVEHSRNQGDWGTSMALAPGFVSHLSQEELDKKPAAKTTRRYAVRATAKDVCFAHEDHPGTLAWEETVNKYAMQIDSNWSDRIHQAVRRELEAQERRFLLCIKTSTVHGKKGKNIEWWTATDEEIKRRTKQRFEASKAVATQERDKPSHMMQMSTWSEGTAEARPHGTVLDLRAAFSNAIQRCQITVESASMAADDSTVVDKVLEAKENKELLVPMSQLRWSHVKERELLHRELATQSRGCDGSMMLKSPFDSAMQYGLVDKLKKAEVHVVRFIQSLMDEGGNDRSAALSNNRSDSGDDRRRNDEDHERDDGDDDDGDDDRGHDHTNRKSRRPTLNAMSPPRKRGRDEAGASECATHLQNQQPDFAPILKANPHAVTKSGLFGSDPASEFGNKAVSMALGDTRIQGVFGRHDGVSGTDERLGDLSTAFQTFSVSLKQTKVKSEERGKDSETQQHNKLTNVISKSRDDGVGKEMASGRLRGRSDDASFTTASSESSVCQAPSDVYGRTLDAYDATMSNWMSEQTLVHISCDRRNNTGLIKGGDAFPTPISKKNSSQGSRLVTAGKMRLYGRDNEIALLNDAYNRILIPNTQSEIVGIHGCSGTGKSTLVKQLEETVAVDKSGIFAAGKFDQINCRPYSAIVDAFSRLCYKIADGMGGERVRLSIEQALGSEVNVLLELIPAIEQLTGVPTHEAAINFKETEHAFTRFKELFRAFLRAAASPNQPIVLFLDDLQWADDESRALLESLASDPESKNVLFVLAHRDSESQSEAPNLLASVVKSSSLRFSDIPVGAVDPQSLNEMVADLVQLDRKEVIPLSGLLSRRTGGNIHFAIQFLNMLERDGLLVFSDELEKWSWDIKVIETRTVVTENVADLLMASIARQPGDVQSVLQLAACLGFFFDIQLLESVASSEGLLSATRPSASMIPDTLPEEIERGEFVFSTNQGHSKFLSLLEIARKEDLVVQTQDCQTYKFAHDHVRQCVYRMIRDPGQREELHLRIGLHLWQHGMSKSNDDFPHFMAIDQLNRGAKRIKDQDTRWRLSQLNLESAGKAVRKSSYSLAAAFLNKGIVLLNPSTMWQKQTYGLSLQLHSKSAEMESMHGNFDASDCRVHIVLERAKTLDDRLRAYFVKLDSLGVRRRMDEAISLGLEVLRQIGEHISQRPSQFSTIVELTKTRRLLKGRKSQELLTLDEMKDEHRAAAMRLLNSVAFFAWHSDRNDILIFVFLRMTRITLTHGLCKYSPFAFATFGMVLGVMGELERAYEFGTLALQLLERGTTSECTSSTRLVVYAFVEHLKMPLTQIGAKLVEAYHVGIKSGQVHYACQCLSAVGGLSVVSGRPLRSVIQDAQHQRQIFQDYNQQFADVLTAPWHQFALNMTGQAANVRELTGDALDERLFLKETVFTIAKVNVHFIRMILLYILGDFEAASEELDVLEHRQGNTEGTHFMSYFILLFSGLVSLAMVQKTGKRKYYARSRKYMNCLAKYTHGGVLNCVPLLMLLQAIQKAIAAERGMTTTTTTTTVANDVQSAFDKAIAACRQGGFTYLEGIANERAGEYMLSYRGNEPEANKYLRLARQCFLAWDADAKVELLDQKYATLLEPAKGITPLLLVLPRAMPVEGP